jgi:hypothetical protein
LNQKWCKLNFYLNKYNYCNPRLSLNSGCN